MHTTRPGRSELKLNEFNQLLLTKFSQDIKKPVLDFIQSRFFY